MTIALTGVFADTAAMQVTTSVAEKANVRITPTTSTDLLTTSTITDLLALTAINSAVSVEKTATDVYTSVAKLNFFSNQTAAFATTFTAKSMASTTTASRIDYTVVIGGVSLLSNDEGDTPSNSLVLKAANTGSSLAGTLPITVKVVDNDWDLASVGTYVGDITFTFTAV
jgi:hypothetical protein